MKSLTIAVLLLLSLMLTGANWRDLQIITDGAMASTNTISSTVVDLSGYPYASLQVAYTGTPTGTLTVNGSDDNSTFYAITFDPVLTQPSGSAGGYLIQLAPYIYRYIKVSYTNASGTGTLNVKLFAKAVMQ